jgi:hypothetical protein
MGWYVCPALKRRLHAPGRWVGDAISLHSVHFGHRQRHSVLWVLLSCYAAGLSIQVCLCDDLLMQIGETETSARQHAMEFMEYSKVRLKYMCAQGSTSVKYNI